MSNFGLLNPISKLHVVVDCDEVLVRISPKWVHLMHTQEHFDYFNQFFRLSPKFNLGRDYERVLMRPKYHLDEWLIRSDVLETQGINAYNKARRDLNDLYRKDVDYYGDLPATGFAAALGITAHSTSIAKITVVTRTMKDSPLLNASKVAFIKNIFSGINHKVDIYLLDDPKESKADVINKLEDVNLIYEDELSNIQDIISNVSVDHPIQLMIPSYGYNTNLPAECHALARDKDINLQYYHDM